MLKQTITYTNFDGEQETETLWFNLSRSRLMENIHIEDELKEISKIFEGPEDKQLTRDEVQRVLEMVKTMMSLAYGERSSDGKRFNQNPEVWENFKQTAAYEAYLWSLFQDPEMANKFITGIVPTAMLEEAKKELAAQGISLPGEKKNNQTKMREISEEEYQRVFGQNQ